MDIACPHKNCPNQAKKVILIQPSWNPETYPVFVLRNCILGEDLRTQNNSCDPMATGHHSLTPTIWNTQGLCLDSSSLTDTYQLESIRHLSGTV